MRIKDAIKIYRDMDKNAQYTSEYYQDKFNWSKSRVDTIFNKLFAWGMVGKTGQTGRAFYKI